MCGIVGTLGSNSELVEFDASNANKYKQRGNKGKWVLKKAMESYLSKDVIYRPKTGFGASPKELVEE